MKKLVTYLLSALVAGVLFALIQWLLYLVGIRGYFDLKEMLIAGYIFGLIYIPVNNWIKKKAFLANTRRT